jgi:DNA-binding response OmpR family regulator
MPSGLMSRILVIDDDPALAELIRSVLADGGHAVTAAAALGPAAPTGHDLVITDLLGGGYCLDEASGWVAEVRRRLPGVPVIVCTAHRDAADHAEALGADAVLTKPFDVEALLALVGRLTAGRPPHTPPH